MDAAAKWAEVMAMNVDVDLKLGPNTADRYIMDPQRIGFYFARYRFASKMLCECTSIVDVGAGDALASMVYLNNTKADQICCIDQDATFQSYWMDQLLPAIKKARPDDARRLLFVTGDVGEYGRWSGLSCIDCIEHVDPEQSLAFVKKLYDAVLPGGVAVIGTPNAYASHLGSAHSQKGHVNNFTPSRLREEMSKYFPHVIIAGMNDELVHFGHPQLWHYVFGVGFR